VTATSDTVPHFISVKGAAARLGMSIDEVYDLVKAGEIAHVQRTPGAKIHILAADVDRWAHAAALAKKATA
jgi:excisionase family DNA binding protein